MLFSFPKAAGAALGLMVLAQLPLSAGAAQDPKQPLAVDKTRIADYLRYAEGWIEGVSVSVADPKPSPIPGFSELDIELTFQKTKIQRVYYLSADGKRIVSGNLYNLDDSPFRTTIDKLQLKGSPARGPENAPVTIVLFGDLQCPYCRTEEKALTLEVLKNHPQDVRVVFKDFPLDIHDWARKAAIGAHCVAQQDPEGFWAYEDYMYNRQADITQDNLDANIAGFAKAQGLDSLRLTTCIENQVTAPIVDANLAQGRALGIDKTPAVIINGRVMMGELPPETLEMVIQIELKRKAAAAKTSPSAAEKCCEVSVPTVGKQ